MGATKTATEVPREKKVKRMKKNLFGKLALVGVGMLAAVGANAQTEANAIITNVEAVFDLVVPVTVAIVTFFVAVRLAKRVVK